jgi:hypothetical protein
MSSPSTLPSPQDPVQADINKPLINPSDRLPGNCSYPIT